MEDVVRVFALFTGVMYRLQRGSKMNQVEQGIFLSAKMESVLKNSEPQGCSEVCCLLALSSSGILYFLKLSILPALLHLR